MFPGFSYFLFQICFLFFNSGCVELIFVFEVFCFDPGLLVFCLFLVCFFVFFV